MDKDFVDDYINYLFEVGAMLPDGVDEDGEMTYVWADDATLMSIDPELVSAKEAYLALALREIEDQLIEMYEKGHVYFELDDNNEVVWSLTEEGRRFLKESENDE